MHQEHNTPWNSLASHFQFFRDNPHLTPRRTGLFARNLPTQGKSLNHFARILSQTITTFSETERAKYHTTSFDAPTSGALFSDELRDRYPKYLNEENQRIEHWILRAKRGHGYGTFDGDLADILQILFNENQMKTIMMLVHHPQIPVHQLQTLSQGYDSGFSRVMEVGLAAYVMLNLFVATGTLQNGTYLESREYRQLVIMMTECMNSRSATQELRDHHFLGALPEDPVSGLPEVHRDFRKLKDYLKGLFSLLYHYDMVVRECGLHTEWEEQVVGLLRYPIGIDVNFEYLYIEGRQVRRFI